MATPIIILLLGAFTSLLLQAVIAIREVKFQENNGDARVAVLSKSRLISSLIVAGLDTALLSLLIFFGYSLTDMGPTLVIGVIFFRAAVHRLLAGVHQFGWERRAELSRITPARFVADSALQGLLLLTATIPLTFGALFILTTYPSGGWLVVGVGWAIFMVARARFYPSLVAPLFNRFEPLADEDLKAAIDIRAANAGCQLSNLSIMDGSTRSAAGNAKVEGFGKGKKVILLDTLFHILKPAEIVAVAAHELGHVRHRHIAQFEGIMGLIRASWVIGFGYFVGQGDPALALTALWLSSPLAAFFIKPPLMKLIRSYEHQADAFAHACGDGKALLSALKKLSTNNRASLKSDPLYRFFNHAHPDNGEREQRLSGRTIHADAA